MWVQETPNRIITNTAYVFSLSEHWEVKKCLRNKYDESIKIVAYSERLTFYITFCLGLLQITFLFDSFRDE